MEQTSSLRPQRVGHTRKLWDPSLTYSDLRVLDRLQPKGTSVSVRTMPAFRNESGLAFGDRCKRQVVSFQGWSVYDPHSFSQQICIQKYLHNGFGLGVQLQMKQTFCF